MAKGTVWFELLRTNIGKAEKWHVGNAAFHGKHAVREAQFPIPIH